MRHMPILIGRAIAATMAALPIILRNDDRPEEITPRTIRQTQRKILRQASKPYWAGQVQPKAVKPSAGIYWPGNGPRHNVRGFEPGSMRRRTESFEQAAFQAALARQIDANAR